jgi:hypothetical protein
MSFKDTIITSDGKEDVFVAKLDNNGNWKWAVRGGGTLTDLGFDVATDDSENVYVTGRFHTSGSFGSTTLTSYGNDDIFVAKINFDGDFESVNNPPNKPSKPYPANNTVNIQFYDLKISWLGGDPDENEVTYDVYFGTLDNITKVISNQTKNEYYPGNLEYETTYYWRIKAWDIKGVLSVGPLWKFTTGSSSKQSTSGLCNILVTTYNEETLKPIANTIVMIDDDDTLYYSDSNGKIIFSTSEGVHTFYVWKKGYLAKDYTVDLKEGENTITIYLSPGSVVLVNVDTDLINYSEIEEVGINVQDKDNYDFYEFDVDLFVKDHELTEYEVWFDIEKESIKDKITSKAKDIFEKGKKAASRTTQYISDKASSWISKKVGKDTSYVWVPKGDDPFEHTIIRYDDGKGNSGYFKKAGDLVKKAIEKVAEVKDKLTNQETSVWIHVEGTTHVLKEFFSVSVEIQNTASSSFSFEDVELTLTIPDSLSLPDLYFEEQPVTKTIDKIQGQSEENVSWIVRGDELGEYTLSVDIDATFMPFNTQIEASGSTIVEVYGLSRLEPIFTPARYVRKNLPFLFTIGIHNPSPVPAYLVSINLDNEAVENISVIGNTTVDLGTIQPGDTKYAAWTLQANVSGFIVLDASSVYTDTDQNLNPKLTFYADSAEGAVTAFYIASQQMLNAEVHALASEITQFRMVFRTSIGDVLRLALKTGLLFHTFKVAPWDVLSPVEYALFLSHFVEGVQYNMLCEDTIISTKSEEEILDIFTVTAYNHTPVSISTFDENVTANEISTWLNEKHNEIIDLIRDNDFTKFSDRDSTTIKNIISQLNIATRQEYCIQFQNNISTVGSLIPLLAEAMQYREDYEFYELIGDLLTIASFSMIFRIGRTTNKIVKLMKMGTTVGKGLGATKEHTIKNLLKAVTIKALATYPLDLENLTKIQLQVYDWFKEIITKTSKSDQLDESDLIITDFVTPDISTIDYPAGSTQGYLLIKNTGSEQQSVYGKIIIHIASEGNPIIQSIPINRTIQPDQEMNITFPYSTMVLPGQPQEYIAEAYLSSQNYNLPVETSLFHSSIFHTSTKKERYSYDIDSKSPASAPMTISPKSILLIASSSPSIDLHLYDTNDNHVGMNYTTHTLDTTISSSTYSGYLSQPQWIRIVNTGNKQKQYSLEIHQINSPDAVNVSVHIMQVDMNASPIIYPTDIDDTISTNKTEHLIITIENQYQSMQITNITINGTITNIIADVWYNATSISYYDQAIVDLTLFSTVEETFSGYINLTYDSTLSDRTNYSIPVTISCSDAPPEILYIESHFFGNKTTQSLNISSIVMDNNNNVSSVKFSIVYPSGKSENTTMIELEGYDYYYYNSTYNKPGEYTYHIWASDSNGNSITSPAFTFTIPTEEIEGMPGFELIIVVIAVALILFWKREYFH